MGQGSEGVRSEDRLMRCSTPMRPDPSELQRSTPHLRIAPALPQPQAASSLPLQQMAARLPICAACLEP